MVVTTHIYRAGGRLKRESEPTTKKHSTNTSCSVCYKLVASHHTHTRTVTLAAACSNSSQMKAKTVCLCRRHKGSNLAGAKHQTNNSVDDDGQK